MIIFIVMLMPPMIMLKIIMIIIITKMILTQKHFLVELINYLLNYAMIIVIHAKK